MSSQINFNTISRFNDTELINALSAYEQHVISKSPQIELNF